MMITGAAGADRMDGWMDAKSNRPPERRGPIGGLDVFIISIPGAVLKEKNGGWVKTGPSPETSGCPFRCSENGSLRKESGLCPQGPEGITSSACALS